jgi:hypothetical protein
MKALSIKQPWASLIAHGIKDIENRTWKTNFRGRIYIHVSGVSAGSPAQVLNKDQLNSFLMKAFFRYSDTSLIKSAIIGEVDIIDCVINHPSIWADKGKLFDLNGYGHTENYKPTYNWVLANPVLYDKPILNVKGKLSFWEWHGCEQTCESCEKYFDIDNMQRDGDDNYFCKECADELFPIMQAEYDEMVAKGEINPEEY